MSGRLVINWLAQGTFQLNTGSSSGTSGHRSNYCGSSRKAELRGHLNQIGDGIGLHLFHDLASVRLHGNLADAQFAADLLVWPAGGYQCHHLAFATGERRVAALESLHFHLTAECDAAAFDGSPDSGQQHLVAEWFCQELLRPGFHGSDRHRDIAVARDENDRHLSPFGSHLLLQVKSVEAWKGNVKYQATRNLGSWTREELRRRCVGLGLPTFAAKERFQRFTYGNVVVDNKHDWNGLRHQRLPHLRITLLAGQKYILRNIENYRFLHSDEHAPFSALKFAPQRTPCSCPSDGTVIISNGG